MSSICPFPALSVPDEHFADCLLTPARVCDHLWEEITSELDGNHYCFFDVIKRVVYFVAFFVLAPCAFLLGGVALALKSCVPITVQPAAFVSEQPVLSLVERAKNKFKHLMNRMDDTFIPQHVVYDEAGNILACGKFRDNVGFVESRGGEPSVFFARSEDAEMVEFEGHFSAVDQSKYPHLLHLNWRSDAKNQTPTTSHVMSATFVAWQDVWGDKFPLSMDAILNKSAAKKMSYADMKALAEWKYRAQITPCVLGISGLVETIVSYLSPFEHVVHHKTMSFIDRTGGAVTFFLRHYPCNIEGCTRPRDSVERCLVAIDTYGKSVNFPMSQFGYCTYYHHSTETTVEFSDIPGIIKMTMQDASKNKSFFAIDMRHFRRELRESSSHFSIQVRKFLPNQDQLTQEDVLVKIDSFLRTHQGFIPDPKKPVLFMPRLGIIVVFGTEESNRIVYYCFGQSVDFLSMDEESFLRVEHPFYFDPNGEDYYFDGELAEKIPFEKIRFRIPIVF